MLVMLEPAKSAADMLKPAAWAACGTSTASGQTLLQPATVAISPGQVHWIWDVEQHEPHALQ